MSTASSTKPVRAGQPQKRSAILAAARDLFVRSGVERTSMDAVASAAGVSKRTVYDYYGDKRRLLLGVIEEAGDALLATVRHGIDEHLADGAEIRDAATLERALTSFAVEVGAPLVASPEYAATVRLITENESLLPELANHPLDAAHTDVLAERFAHFADDGLLDVPDPRMAADHYSALTTLLAFHHHQSTESDPARIRRIMAEGARAFLRAYGRR